MGAISTATRERAAPAHSITIGYDCSALAARGIEPMRIPEEIAECVRRELKSKATGDATGAFLADLGWALVIAAEIKNQTVRPAKGDQRNALTPAAARAALLKVRKHAQALQTAIDEVNANPTARGALYACAVDDATSAPGMQGVRRIPAESESALANLASWTPRGIALVERASQALIVDKTRQGDPAATAFVALVATAYVARFGKLPARSRKTRSWLPQVIELVAATANIRAGSIVCEGVFRQIESGSVAYLLSK